MSIRLGSRFPEPVAPMERQQEEQWRDWRAQLVLNELSQVLADTGYRTTNPAMVAPRRLGKHSSRQLLDGSMDTHPLLEWSLRQA